MAIDNSNLYIPYNPYSSYKKGTLILYASVQRWQCVIDSGVQQSPVYAPNNWLFLGFAGTNITSVTGIDSIQSTTVLSTGAVTLQLVGDIPTPTATQYYGTDAGGVRGFYNVPSATIAEPVDQIVFGTGTGVSSSPNALFDPLTNNLTAGDLSSISSEMILSVDNVVGTIALESDLGSIVIAGSLGSYTRSPNNGLIVDNKNVHYSLGNQFNTGYYLDISATTLQYNLATNSSFGVSTLFQIASTGATTIKQLGGSGAGIVGVSNTGLLSWMATPTAITPAGSTTQVQLNVGGSFGATPNFVYDPSTDIFQIGKPTDTYIVGNNGGHFIQLLSQNVLVGSFTNGNVSIGNSTFGIGITNASAISLTGYGSGAVTGTAAFGLAVTSGGKLIEVSTSGGGTVTAVSIVSANGFAGSSSGGTTPALTISTSITANVLKGNGTAILAAVADTDYQSPLTFTTTGTSGAATFSGHSLNIPIYQAAGTCVTSISVASSNGLAGSSSGGATPILTLSTSITGILQGNGTAISAATTGNLTDVGTDGITIGSGTGAVLGSGTTISQHVADSTHNGYLSSTDWSTFNGKSTVTPAALTKTDDTNVTLTLGGTPATSLLQAASLTLGWTGTLSPTRGGTGQNSSGLSGIAVVNSGTWSFVPQNSMLVGRGYASIGTLATGTTTFPLNNTIPVNTAGNEFLTVTYTPKNAANILIITALFPTVTNSVATPSAYAMALFQDATSNALCANAISTVALQVYTMSLRHQMTAGTTSSTVFKIRIGCASAGTMAINGSNSTTQIFGGVNFSSLQVEEYTA